MQSKRERERVGKGGAAPYLGEERALVVRELDLRDVEELELPLGRCQHRHAQSCRDASPTLTGVTAMLLSAHRAPWN